MRPRRNGLFVLKDHREQLREAGVPFNTQFFVYVDDGDVLGWSPLLWRRKFTVHLLVEGDYIIVRQEGVPESAVMADS